jgi:hypothetical protein
MSISDYINEGLVQDRPYPHVSGNGLLYTAEYLIGLIKAWLPPPAMFWKSVLAHELAPGIMQRTLINGCGQESLDDYFAVAYLCKVYKQPRLANRILECEMTNFPWLKHVHNNEIVNEFSIRAYLGRFMHLIGAFNHVVGKRVGILQQLSMYYVLTKKEDASAHDRWTLPYILCEIMADHDSWLIKRGIAKFKANFAATYPSLGRLLAAYFAQEVEHPMCALLDNCH